MRKEKIKGLVLGLIIGAMITGGTTLALNASTLYDVITDGVSIVVDGKKLNPTDANGNEVQPMIYNGTTYLPVRTVANALGKAVYWDGPNYTVYLGEMDGKLEYPTVYLKDMTNIAAGSDSKVMTLATANSNFQEQQNNITYFYTQDENERNLDGPEFLLNYKYDTFKCTFFVPEGSTFIGETYFNIIADDKIIYTSPKIDKTSQSSEILIKVKGYNHIKIVPFRTRAISWSSSLDGASYIYLADAGFYQ